MFFCSLLCNCALFLLVRVFLHLSLHILFDILFPFCLGLRLQYSGNKLVYFSTCLFVISCNFANISLHWPSFFFLFFVFCVFGSISLEYLA